MQGATSNMPLKGIQLRQFRFDTGQCGNINFALLPTCEQEISRTSFA